MVRIFICSFIIINTFSQIEENNTDYDIYSLTDNLIIKSNEYNDYQYIFKIDNIEIKNDAIQIIQLQGIFEYLNHLAYIHINNCSYEQGYIEDSEKTIQNHIVQQVKINYKDILITTNKFQYLLNNNQKKIYKIYPEYYAKYKDIIIFGTERISIYQNKITINQLYINEKNNLFSGALNKLRINYKTKTISILDGSANLQHDLKLTFNEIISDNFEKQIIINKLKIDQNKLSVLSINKISINIIDQNVNLYNVEIEVPNYYIENNIKYKLPKNIILRADKGFINKDYLILEDVKIYHKNKEIFMIKNIKIDLNKLLKGEDANV